MNKKELDAHIENIRIRYVWKEFKSKEDIKEFIFNEIIAEVLNSIIPDIYEEDYNKNIICINDIKQKAKDLYNITL